MNRPASKSDYPSFRRIYDGDLSDGEREYLASEDPCRYLTTDLDVAPRVRGLESHMEIVLWRKAVHALAEHFGLEPQERVLALLDKRAERLRRQTDQQAAITAVEEAPTEQRVQELLEQEVGRHETRKEVVAAANQRLDELRGRQPVASDGGDPE